MMKIRSVILLLTGIFACIPASAQEKDRGYWSLTESKVLYEGERSIGDKTGIIGGSNGKAQFRILHEKHTPFKADGTYSVSQREGVTRINIGGKSASDQRYIHTLQVSWSRPPEYVKVGEENKISIDVRALLDGQDYSPELLARDLDAKVKSTLNGKEKEYSARKLGLGTKESYTTELSVSIMPEFTIRNTVFGFDMMNRSLSSSNSIEEYESTLERVAQNTGAGEDEVAEVFKKAYANNQYSTEWDCSVSDKSKARLSCQDAWEQHLPLGKESCLMVSVNTTFSSTSSNPYKSSSSSSYTICQFYLYKYYPNGGDVEKTVRADDDDAWKTNGDEGGESEGTTLPPWVIPTAVGTIVGGIGYKIVKKRRRKKDEEDPDPNDPNNPNDDDDVDDDEPKKPSTYKMILYKNFGSTLTVGDEPQMVGARIEEITAEGKKIKRHDLTQQIEIEQGNHLRIVETGMVDKYKAAYITADEYPKEEPHEGDVWFIFRSLNGALKNKVVFKIEKSEIIFGQDNLTIPSGYEKEVRLPFVAVGFDGSKEITARIVPSDGNEELANTYSVEVEWSEKDRLHYAIIRDLKPAGKLAGKYERHQLEIEVPSKVGEPIKGTLDVRRFHMGLALHVGDIGCYIEPYDSGKHKSRRFAFMGPEGRTFVPAETLASIVLYEYDEAEHKVLQLAPVLTGCKWKAFNDEKQQLVDKLGLQCELTEELGDKGGREAVFRCCRCSLDAPQRIEAIVQLAASHLDREYTSETKVLLCSQPIRHFGSLDDEMAALKQDEHVTERLLHIQKAIYEQGLYEKLFPLEKFIDVMLEGYKPEYGYDPAQVKRVRDLYTGVLSGRIEGANGQAAKPMTLAEEVGLFLEVFITNSKKVEESMGFFTRMVVGVATMGCSEAVFTGLEVVSNMKEYVDNGGDSIWGGFYVGAKVVVREYITEKVTMGAMNKLSDVAKKAGLTPDAIKKGAMEMVEEGKGYLNTIKGKVMKNAINDSTEATGRAVSKSKMIKEMAKAQPLTKAEKELMQISEFGLEHAKEQVRDLQAAVDLYRMNPHGPGNKEMLNKLILDVQQNKQAMYLLKEADSSLNYVRSEFNNTLETIYKETDEAVKKKLAKRLGLPDNYKIEVLNATSSDKALLLEGKKITMDRDITYYWKDEFGDVHYFSQKSTTDLYNKEFYEKALGYKPADSKFANRFANKMDQTNIEDVLFHPESYGDDLNNMLKEEFRGRALLDPTKVGDTVTYKGKEWFGKGEALLKEANNITDLTERQLMQSQGLSSIMEGLRQEVKQFDNFVNPRNMARLQANGASRIPENLRTAVECCRRVSTMESADALVQIERELSLLGYTRDSFAEAMGQAIKDIG